MDAMFDSLFNDPDDGGYEPPLAVRMRPRTLDEFIGQEQAVGRGTWLRRSIEQDKIVPVILYGPPGVGKTTLARIIAAATESRFAEVSAVGGSVADLRKAISEAEAALRSGQKTILFVDEIHRFNKNQQDALLHAVEDRVLILVGATTENPYFEVNSALLSRMRIVELRPLNDDGVKRLVKVALVDERGLDGAVEMGDEAVSKLVSMSSGDARAALTTLELAADIAMAQAEEFGGEAEITPEIVEQAAPHAAVRYDKDGDEHYDVISAFIKSMRGSDPDAAIYWLARMIDAGEDPKFIARRMMIFAAEDVGVANPYGVCVAEAAFRSAEVIGYPECRINLAQAAVFLSIAPKSNSAYMAINSALAHVRENGMEAVPDHLRDRHRPGSDEYGEYLYPHSYEDHWVDQQYLPDGIEKGEFYQPGKIGWEGKIWQG